MNESIAEMVRRSMERYHPCTYGLHFCGMDEDANEFYTVLNLPAADAAEARRFFEIAREHEVAEEDREIVVDLCLGPHDVNADLSIRRQSVEVIARAVAPPVEE